MTHYSTYANYAAGASDKIVEYAYDSFNHLIGRIIDADGSAGAGGNAETVYAYDGDQIALQFDHAGSGDATAAELSHRYFWNAQAVDQLFAEEQTHYDSQQAKIVSDAVLWALTDHENSIRDLAIYNSGTDATTVADHRIYDAYGNLTSETAAVDCVFGYTGRQTDAATGLQNNLNRWYDPSTGRWISQDPISFAGGDANLYRYVGNDPLNNNDPNGLCRNSVAWGAIKGFFSGLVDSFSDGKAADSVTGMGVGFFDTLADLVVALENTAKRAGTATRNAITGENNSYNDIQRDGRLSDFVRPYYGNDQEYSQGIGIGNYTAKADVIAATAWGTANVLTAAPGVMSSLYNMGSNVFGATIVGGGGELAVATSTVGGIATASAPLAAAAGAVLESYGNGVLAPLGNFLFSEGQNASSETAKHTPKIDDITKNEGKLKNAMKEGDPDAIHDAHKSNEGFQKRQNQRRIEERRFRNGEELE